MAASRGPGPIDRTGMPPAARAPAECGPARCSFGDAPPTGRGASPFAGVVDWIDLWQAAPGKSPRDRARWLVSYFASHGGPKAFRRVDRWMVAAGLIERVDRPGLIHQAGSSLCGPASLLFDVASRDPVAYVQFVIDLFERGAGRLGRLQIAPGEDLKNYAPPLGRRPGTNDSGIAPADWVPLASIRDSDNWFFDYDEVGDEFSGITLPHELADWFRQNGYTQVINETNVWFTKDEPNARRASQLYLDRFRVCLFVNAQVLDATTQDNFSFIPNHWVVLVSPIVFSGANVHFEIFTWGDGRRRVPWPGFSLPLSSLLKNYYGFVAAKY